MILADLHVFDADLVSLFLTLYFKRNPDSRSLLTVTKRLLFFFFFYQKVSGIITVQITHNFVFGYLSWCVAQTQVNTRFIATDHKLQVLTTMVYNVYWSNNEVI